MLTPSPLMSAFAREGDGDSAVMAALLYSGFSSLVVEHRVWEGAVEDWCSNGDYAVMELIEDSLILPKSTKSYRTRFMSAAEAAAGLQGRVGGGGRSWKM